MAKHFTMNAMPFMECPKCGHSWQVSDYYDLDFGSQLECPKCEQLIDVTFRETTITLWCEARAKKKQPKQETDRD